MPTICQRVGSYAFLFFWLQSYYVVTQILICRPNVVFLFSLQKSSSILFDNIRGGDHFRRRKISNYLAQRVSSSLKFIFLERREGRRGCSLFVFSKVLLAKWHYAASVLCLGNPSCKLQRLSNFKIKAFANILCSILEIGLPAAVVVLLYHLANKSVPNTKSRSKQRQCWYPNGIQKREFCKNTFFCFCVPKGIIHVDLD